MGDNQTTNYIHYYYSLSIYCIPVIHLFFSMSPVALFSYSIIAGSYYINYHLVLLLVPSFHIFIRYFLEK